GEEGMPGVAPTSGRTEGTCEASVIGLCRAERDELLEARSLFVRRANQRRAVRPTTDHFRSEKDRIDRELAIDPILLASKMVGRWPNGAPLVRAPDKETAGLEQFVSFGSAQTDHRGLACPLGSATRWSNPRHSLFS